jgi:hypothetical protein
MATAHVLVLPSSEANRIISVSTVSLQQWRDNIYDAVAPTFAEFNSQ